MPRELAAARPDGPVVDQPRRGPGPDDGHSDRVGAAAAPCGHLHRSAAPGDSHPQPARDRGSAARTEPPRAGSGPAHHPRPGCADRGGDTSRDPQHTTRDTNHGPRDTIRDTEKHPRQCPQHPHGTRSGLGFSAQPGENRATGDAASTIPGHFHHPASVPASPGNEPGSTPQHPASQPDGTRFRATSHPPRDHPGRHASVRGGQPRHPGRHEHHATAHERAAAHATMFHFVKQPRYYAAVDDIREPYSGGEPLEAAGAPRNGHPGNGAGSRRTRQAQHGRHHAHNPLGKLPGSVWDPATMTTGDQPMNTTPGRTLVIRGDAAHLPLPDGSVDLIVTSPPFFALRSYTDGGKHYAGQLGSEPTPAEYIAALVTCTREWVRVLKPDGSMFIELGDKYAPAIQQ